jgi:PAS domain-containing protein
VLNGSASTTAGTPSDPFSPQPAELIASGLLSAPLESETALIYLKDRCGRYLRVNRRLTDSLGVPAERLTGRRDEELPPGETIDGPRVHDGTAPNPDARALQYFVPEFANRPELAVLRFTVLDASGAVAGSCGVAAPTADAAAARAEGERLLEIAGLLQDPAPAADTAPELAEELLADASDECAPGDGQENSDWVRRDGVGAPSRPLAEPELEALRAELAQTRAELMEARAELAIARRDLARRPRENGSVDGLTSTAAEDPVPAAEVPVPTPAPAAAVAVPAMAGAQTASPAGLRPAGAPPVQRSSVAGRSSTVGPVRSRWAFGRG